MSNPRQILLHPRDEIMQIMQRIYRYRMTTTSGGNLSIRDANGDIWITPARVDKGSLRREDIVCVRPNERREGVHLPSSELPFHQAIYQRRPDLGARRAAYQQHQMHRSCLSPGAIRLAERGTYTGTS